MYGTCPPKNAKIGGFWILVLDGIPWGLIGTAGFSTQWATVVGSQFFFVFGVSILESGFLMSMRYVYGVGPI